MPPHSNSPASASRILGLQECATQHMASEGKLKKMQSHWEEGLTWDCTLAPHPPMPFCLPWLTGATAAGGRCPGLPGPRPSFPALLFLLVVLPAAEDRRTPGSRLLLHRLVRHHSHVGLQVSMRGPPEPVSVQEGGAGGGVAWGCG